MEADVDGVPEGVPVEVDERVAVGEVLAVLLGDGDADGVPVAELE